LLLWLELSVVSTMDNFNDASFVLEL